MARKAFGENGLALGVAPCADHRSSSFTMGQMITDLTISMVFDCCSAAKLLFLPAQAFRRRTMARQRLRNLNSVTMTGYIMNSIKCVSGALTCSFGCNKTGCGTAGEHGHGERRRESPVLDDYGFGVLGTEVNFSKMRATLNLVGPLFPS